MSEWLFSASTGIGFWLIVVGFVGRVWCKEQLAQVGIYGRAMLEPHEPTAMLKTGPYALPGWFGRHPLYASHLLVLAGLGIVALGWGGFVLAYAGYFHLEWRAAIEDEALRQSAAWRRMQAPDEA